MIGDFRQLEVWQKAHKLTLEVYATCKLYPKAEIFNLVSQTERAAVSVELNIAEGHGRFHYLDEAKFLFTARGSAAETLCCLLIAIDLGYASKEKTEKIINEYEILVRQINALIKYKKERARKEKAGKVDKS